MKLTPISIHNNGPIDIAIGRSRKELTWKNREMRWSELVQRISNTHRTVENYSEYIAAKKSRQDEIKDIGGFVGGYLTGGRRKPGSVLHRQLLTLDLDFAKATMWEDFTFIYDNASAIYSTHKHSPESPRLRLIMPLNRPVFSDEYIAIARRIAGNIGIEAFDATGFQPYRLMYWPSTSKDAEFVFEYQDGPWINADEVLATYHNWRDASEWPMSNREKSIPDQAIKKQGDPLEKPGIVGAFCRTYDIHQAIEELLPDTYEPCDIENRYTYKEGSTAAGLVVYDDKYAYSHHGTDPVSGRLCNSFDLVRLHKFELKDEDAREGTPINKLPSYLAMQELATKDPKVLLQIGEEKLSRAQHDFEDWEEDEDNNKEWLKQMEVDVNKNYRSTTNNILLVLENHPPLKGRIAFNELEHREEILKDLPWRKRSVNKYWTDADDAHLRHYLEKYFKLTTSSKITDAVIVCARAKAFHPIRDYLNSLEWDGIKRVDSLLVDYLGAMDSPYIRAVIRKMLVAAVARVFEPGVKVDTVLIIIGPQGIGKSTLIRKLGKAWYSDSFSFHQVGKKEADEQLQGVWLIEIGELAGMLKKEIESVKHFITKQVDRFRVAYGKRTESFARQCIFFATSNNPEPLRDTTGNRRFLPADTGLINPTKDVFSISEDEINQIWAEAMALYKAGEQIFLSAELEAEARKVQADHTEQDPRRGLIQDYLETLLPADWGAKELYERREWLRSEDPEESSGTVVRDKVCTAEIWSELFGKRPGEINRNDTKDIHDIMRSIPGWSLGKATKRFRIYGTQRVYVRTKISVNRASKNVNGVNRKMNASVNGVNKNVNDKGHTLFTDKPNRINEYE